MRARLGVISALLLAAACGRTSLGDLDALGGEGLGGEGQGAGAGAPTSSGGFGGVGEGGFGGFGAAGLGPGPGPGPAVTSVTSVTTGPSGFCGDGFVDPGEACDLGPGNADRSALSASQAGKFEKALRPVEGKVDASVFYNYFSASSHTGFEALHASRMYFYRDGATGILSLFVHHGIDQTTSGQKQPGASAKMDLLGIPPSSTVAIADDSPSEFQKTSATTLLGSWQFQRNTDGGVLSALPFPGTWEITVTAGFTSGIKDWELLDGDASATALSKNASLTLRAHAQPSACRTTCTVPRCGDGILDGGETCDDGNTKGGDGCSALCKLE